MSLKPQWAFSGKCGYYISLFSFFFSIKADDTSKVFLFALKRKKHAVNDRWHRWIRKVTLTLMFTLAELLTEILGYYTGAGAVAWVVRVVTWLVVVHLIGWVIWSNRGQSPQTDTLHCVVPQKGCLIVGWTYLSLAESLPITCLIKQTQWKGLFSFVKHYLCGMNGSTTVHTFTCKTFNYFMLHKLSDKNCVRPNAVLKVIHTKQWRTPF